MVLKELSPNVLRGATIWKTGLRLTEMARLRASISVSICENRFTPEISCRRRRRKAALSLNQLKAGWETSALVQSLECIRDDKRR